MENVDDVELLGREPAREHRQDQWVLVVAELAIGGVARVHAAAVHRDALNRLVALEPVL